MSRLERALEKARTGQVDPGAAGGERRDASSAASVFISSWDFGEPTDKVVRIEPASPRPVRVEPRTEPTPLLREFSAKVRKKLVVGADASRELREQFRKVAASLYRIRDVRPLKVLMIVSAVPGEGKTLTSANLALTLSESYGSRVLLLDADLRRPSLHNVFDIPNNAGLREALLSDTGVITSPTRISANLDVLTAGKVAMDPMTLLTSDGMRSLLERAAEAFEWVLIDTPPVGLLPDAGLLTSVADGAILVVRAGSTRCQLARHAVEAIGRERILGVVLNQLTDEMRPSVYKHYGYYE